LRRLAREFKESLWKLYEAKIEYLHLGKIERGEINTTVISMKRIADILGVDVKKFFDL
jgi:hypothetical protein